MDGFVFNQPKGTVECGWRCIYSILRTYARTDLDFGGFLSHCRRRFKRDSAFQVDIYAILDEAGIPFGNSFPTPKGTYLVFFPIESPESQIMHHAIIYRDEVVFDSGVSEPRPVPIRRFIDLVRPKGPQHVLRGLICVEVFGRGDSDTPWEEKKSHSRSSPSTTSRVA